ncbi:MAG: type II toxin-antitoxin system HicB family antitoxin [Burkholderiales bacterium]
MNNVFECKGYLGSAEIDTEGMALVGKLLFIRDVITYSAPTPEGLKTAFEEAVDDYLETCVELGEEPDTPCKGVFNVRVGPELHRQAAQIARSRGQGLNEFVCQALGAAVMDKSKVTVQLVHRHEVVHDRDAEERYVATTTQPTYWKPGRATH